MFSHIKYGVVFPQYGVVEQKIVLKENKRGEAVECNLNLEMVIVVRKVEDIEQHNIVEIEDEVRMEAEDYDQHYDEEFERYQREIELLKYLLRDLEYGSGIAISDGKVSQVLVDIGENTSLQTYDMFVGIEKGYCHKKVEITS